MPHTKERWPPTFIPLVDHIDPNLGFPAIAVGKRWEDIGKTYAFSMADCVC
jgi:hypothetical protein